MKNEDPIPAIILLVVGAVFVCVWQFSRSIGADFQVTFEALLSSLGVLLAGFAVWWFVRPGPLLLLTGCSIFLWPIWWPVLDSIAAGGQKPDIWLPQEQLAIWWNNAWFKRGVESSIIGAFICLLVQRARDPYA